jgi:hypothetical protein
MADAEQEETIIRHYFLVKLRQQYNFEFSRKKSWDKNFKKNAFKSFKYGGPLTIYSNYCWITETDPLERSVRIVQ